MPLTLINYQDLHSSAAQASLHNALFTQGIVGITGVSKLPALNQALIAAAQEFALLPAAVKQQYAPNRDHGETEGYELGAEKFQTADGNWIVDTKKASYYANVPDNHNNRWPPIANFRHAYLALGEALFNFAKLILTIIGVDEGMQIAHQHLSGFGRLLHYQQDGVQHAQSATDWCGAHFDHGLFTVLSPAYYFERGLAIKEPNDAGLFVRPRARQEFVKIPADDKSMLLCQVGEFLQLASDDKFSATEHLVKKALGEIERYTYALFISGNENTCIQPNSELCKDARYQAARRADGRINFADWSEASFARYRAS